MSTSRSPLVTAFRVLERVPLVGRPLFTQGYKFAAPYFLTIPATVESIEPGRATARMWAAPWTRNHLGTVHAIALCNLAELTMGAVAEATVPPTHRWLPIGMRVSYDAKARGTMHATATLSFPADPGERTTVPVEVSIADGDGTVVCRVTIDIHVTPSPGPARQAKSS